MESTILDHERRAGDRQPAGRDTKLTLHLPQSNYDFI
jgi:hypothetical protein